MGDLEKPFCRDAPVAGLASGSARPIGRLTFERFRFFGSHPSDKRIVARRSANETVRSSTVRARLSDDAIISVGQNHESRFSPVDFIAASEAPQK